MNTDFSRLGTEHKTLHTDEVTQVQQLLEDDVVQVFVLSGTDGVALHIHLDATLRVLQLGEGGLAHDALAHDAACNADHATVLRCGGFAHVVAFFIFPDDGQVLEVLYDVCAPRIDGIFCGRIGVDTHLAQLLQTLTSANLLFTEF